MKITISAGTFTPRRMALVILAVIALAALNAIGTTRSGATPAAASAKTVSTVSTIPPAGGTAIIRPDPECLRWPILAPRGFCAHTPTVTTRSGMVSIVAGLLIATAPAAGPPPSPSPGGATQLKLASSGEGPRAITDPRQDVLLQSEAALTAILAKHPQVAGSGVWSMNTQTLTVNVAGSVEEAGSEAAALARDIAQAALPVTIRFKAVPRSTSTMLAAVHKVVSSKAEWAKGLTGLSYVTFSETDGAVIVGVDQKQASRWRSRVEKAGFDVPVVVKGESQIGVTLE